MLKKKQVKKKGTSAERHLELRQRRSFAKVPGERVVMMRAQGLDVMRLSHGITRARMGGGRPTSVPRIFLSSSPSTPSCPGAGAPTHYYPKFYPMAPPWARSMPPSTRSTLNELSTDEPVWQRIRKEAEGMCSRDDLLKPLVHATILSQRSLEQAAAYHLAAKLAKPGCVSAVQWQPILAGILESQTHGATGVRLGDMLRSDLIAVEERDPACPTLAHGLVFFKGLLGIQAQRIMHWLWHNDRQPTASLLQSRVSEVFGMDLHPGAQLGRALMFDHATGLVIGETAIIGDGCTLYHGVTLGGTGKGTGHRHPTLGDNVIVGAGATILGNIRIGDGARVASGSMVIETVPNNVTVAGNPARRVVRRKRPKSLPPATAGDTVPTTTSPPTSSYIFTGDRR